MKLYEKFSLSVWIFVPIAEASNLHFQKRLICGDRKTNGRDRYIRCKEKLVSFRKEQRMAPSDDFPLSARFSFAVQAFGHWLTISRSIYPIFSPFSKFFYFSLKILFQKSARMRVNFGITIVFAFHPCYNGISQSISVNKDLTRCKVMLRNCKADAVVFERI